MSMDLEELRVFIAVAETGSYLRAASQLRVSRTTLKRHVASLEARAGVPLLESARRGVVPTEAGRELARQGRTMIQEASALLASIREVGHAPSGTLHVVLPVGLPPHVVSPLLAALRSAYPKLSFRIRCSDDPLAEPLRDVDIAVHFGETAPRSPWTSYVVMRVREGLIASRAYLERRGAPRSIAELPRHELFAWQAPGEDPRVWRTWKGASFSVEPALVSTDIHLVRRCCIDGFGIGLVPDSPLRDPMLTNDDLVSVLPDVVGQERALRLSVPKALAGIPKIKMILDRVQAFVGDL